MKHLLLLVVLLLAACPGVEPVRPTPTPVPPAPDAGPRPDPTGRPCERAAARAEELRCGYERETFVKACERYEEAAVSAPAFSWDPMCMAEARSCDALAACRSQ